MGLQIGDIITKNQIEFSDLKGKTIAVDAFNANLPVFNLLLGS